MPFLLMLFLTLACLPESWPAPADWVGSPRVSLALTGLVTALEIGLACYLSLRVGHLARAGRLSHDEILRRYSRGRVLHQIGLFAGYSLALYVFGYGWAVHAVWSLGGRPLPLVELPLLAPFFAALVLSWLVFYDAEKALHVDPGARQGPSRWAYLGFHVRQNLALVLLPVALLLFEKELRRQVPALNEYGQVQAVVVGVVAAVAVFVAMPWILRLVLGLRPLPDGPLRERLLAAAGRLRFRCSDILVWNTTGGVANALVVGVLPWLRYVVFTDRLLEELSPEEVEAVFGHEVGHVKHRHMPVYFVFLLASVAVLGAVLAPYQDRLDDLLNLRERRDLAVLPVVGSLGLYVFLVFGFLSRRCERQADVYGCRAVSCSRPDCLGHAPGDGLPDGDRHLCPTGILMFVQALEKVAFLNGISRERPGFLHSWQHSTVARRVDFLKTLLRDPGAEPRFQRRVFLVKCALFAALALVFVWQVT